MHGSTGGGWKRNANASPRQSPTQPHSWPARVTVRRGWAKEWESMGELLPFDALGIPMEVDQAARQLNDMLTHRPPGRA